jgi:hypothetical protein
VVATADSVSLALSVIVIGILGILFIPWDSDD